MTFKRRNISRPSLLTPALSKPHRLGDAVSQALGQQRLPAPAMAVAASRRYTSAGGWSKSQPWQHGRVIGAAPPIQAPTWNYSQISQMSSAAAHQGGIALLELMLVIGVIAIGTTGVVATYKVVDNNRKINDEVEHATTIANNIVANSVTRGDFSIINQENALRDGLFPSDMLDRDGNPRSAWGGDVLVTATNIEGKPNWGSVLTFEGVPAGACAKLVSQAAPGFYGVTIENESVRTNYGPLNMAAVAQLCDRDAGARVQFTYAKHGGAGESFDQVSPCTVPAPQTDVVIDAACPAGQLGTITYRTDFVCQSPYGPAADLPAVEVSSTCTPACVLPSPSSQNNTESRTGTQVLACPAGQSSTTPTAGGITQTRTEQRNQTRTASCPATPGYSNPVGPYVWSAYTPFTPWAGTTPWATQSSTCAPNCVIPSPSTETDTENRSNTQTLACPSGELGQVDQARPEYRTRTRTATCPATTGDYSWSVWGTWSAWTATAPWATTSNTCAPECTLPTPSTQSNAESRTVSQTVACPSGQLAPDGSTNGITQQRSEQRTQTRTATCPRTTGAYTWGTWSEFGAWTASTPWTQTANVCAPVCTLPVPSTETNGESRAGSQTFTCPPGQLITSAGPSQYLSSGAQTRPETRSQNRTASCPAATGSYTWSAWSTFTAWDSQTAWSPTYTCAPTCTAPAPVVTPNSQTASCLSGRVTPAGAATFTQNRTTTVNYTCPTPTGSATASTPIVSAWSPTEASACATKCVAPPNTPETMSAAPQTQVLNCAAGQYGQVNQSRTVTQSRAVTNTCTAPTGTAYTTAYGTWGAPYTYGTWTTTSGACTACPAASSETQSQWLATSGACPAGQSGSINWEREQTQTRSVNYTCPAGTTTLPLATNGPWSAWADSDVTRNIVNSCAPTCAAPPNSTETGSLTASCSVGRVTPAGAATFTQTRTRSVTNSCPAPTGAYTTAYGTWSAYSPTEATACATKCVAPATTNTPESQGASCAAGRVTPGGAGTFTQTRVRTNTYSCPTPTGVMVTNPATYTAWTPAETAACAPQCVAPATTNTGESQGASCLAGRVTPAGASTFTQTRTRTNTYSCPTPTGAWGANAATYTGWAPPETTACATQCVAPTPQTRWVATSDTACPAGTSGTRYYDIEQRADGTCAAPTGPAGYGGWYNTGAYRNLNTASCAPAGGTSCTLAAASSRTWMGDTQCIASIPAGTYSHGSFATAIKGGSLKNGVGYFQCYNGVITTAADPASWCTFGDSGCTPTYCP